MRLRRPVAAGIFWLRVCRMHERRLRVWRPKSARSTVWDTIQLTKRATESFERSELKFGARRRKRRFARGRDTMRRRVNVPRVEADHARSHAYLSFDII